MVHVGFNLCDLACLDLASQTKCDNQNRITLLNLAITLRFILTILLFRKFCYLSGCVFKEIGSEGLIFKSD